jgi:hypothetical protein
MLALRARLLNDQRTDQYTRQTALIRTYDLSTDQVIDTRLGKPIVGASTILDGDLTLLLEALQSYSDGVPPASSSA